MNFEKRIRAKLINIRQDSFTDKRTGELTHFFRVDLVGKVDDQLQALQLTCGARALKSELVNFKPNSEVDAVVIPRSRNNRVSAALVSLSPAA